MRLNETPLVPSRRRLQRAMTAAAALLLSGCMMGPDYAQPDPPRSARFTETDLPIHTVATSAPGGVAQRFDPGRDIPGEWWTLFQSQQIADLVTQALKANPDLAAAAATLRQAQENARAAQGGLYPQVALNANYQRQQASLAQFGFGQRGTVTYTFDTANVSVAYTLDLWGGVRRQI